MRITIAYVTSRRSPRLDWTLRGLEAQAEPGDEIELIVVDALGRPPTEIGLVPCSPVKSVIAAEPKPCAWQGRQRVTGRDWWAMANARNTAVALAGADYLVFLDDRCWLGPGWLASVRRAEASRESVVVGAYEKIEVGRVSRDHRLIREPRGRRDCGGGWLYGCTFGLPLEWLLDVNGFEEGCDGLSGEDYVLGLMLGNRGRRIDFDPRMLVRQERSGVDHGCVRADKGTSPRDKSNAALARFGGRTRTEFTPDLRAIRAAIAAGGRFPDVDRGAPHLDWYDGQPIRDMAPRP
jgi:hypothetical protein